MKNIKYLNAGAGSGKTYFLTNTLADLVLSNKCTPSEVIMTTFSEKAAADIKRNARIRFLEKKDYEAAAGLDAANIGTVHAVAYKYIQKYWYLLGISARCEVMSDDNKAAYIALTLGRETRPDDIDVFRRFVETVGLTQSQSTRLDYDFWKGAVADIISKADSMGVGDLGESRSESLQLIDSCCSSHPDYKLIRECAEHVFDIAIRWRERFETFKKDNSIIEYNDMENYFLAMLKEDKYAAVQEEIRQSVKYIFVDEFQDSNPKQLEIFDRLSELVLQSFWVGDPKQAIYGFRGSDTDLVEALTKHIRGLEAKGESGFETGTLEVSRRSLRPLVDFTNNVFVKVFPDLDPKDVILKPTHRTESLPGDFSPLIQHWVGPTAPGKILKSGKTGTPKVANKAQTITDLASEVRRILDGRSDIRQVFDKDTRELRDIKASDIAVLCRTNSDVNNVAKEFRRYGIPVVVSETAEAGRMEIRLVLLMLNYNLGDSKLLTAELAKLCCGLSLKDILEKDYSELEDLTRFLKKYREELSGKGVASIVRGLIVRMNLLDRCAKWGDGEMRKNNLMAFIQNARDYEDSCLTLGESATLEGFISRIQNGEITVDGYASDGVSILTYHGSKGLQWPLVIMFSLSSDSLTDKQLAKSFLWDVRSVRKSVPSETNLYPGYYITYVPKLTNQYQSGLPDDMDTEIRKLTGPGDYQSFQVAQVKEGRRLLYVGVTRARDILVEVGQHDSRQKGLQMLTDTLSVMNAPGWVAKTTPDMPSDTWQEIWGPGTPKFFYREIDEEDPPADSSSATYSFAKEVVPNGETRHKRVSPSGIEDEDLVKAVKVNCLNDGDGPFPQLIVTKAATAGDDVVGTCIHNIFAVCNPETERDVMTKAAADTIARHGLDGVLNSPNAIVTSAEILFEFLEDAYGKPVRVEHELPFRELRSGQMTVGSIDLVWFTSENECVLVDFKNLPGAGRNVLNRDDSRYLGHYAPQQAAYRDALTRGGYKVKACLLYLSMQGKVVELGM